ncbi:M28 family peptidase [Pontibacter arcticus]|uniref:Peptidase M20 n=1 Tax=Pontibacter arcticus TaxID=2080288 RepID=A0A364RBT5_9BACT|nr:M28 family peptidase [Pontibacter arcticus]RAU81752.1 peptidase M20 [Pontibacter arcticus]
MRMKIALLFFALLPFVSVAQSNVLNKTQLLQDVKVLSADSLGGRLSGSSGNKRAQQYIEKRFQQLGLQPYNKSYKQFFTLVNRELGSLQATNLIGYIPGKSGKAIVITAHYDHVGQRGNEIYNGADDNASGVGGLLAAIAYFSKNKPDHTLIFAALDAEEQGLKGAEAFLKNPPVPVKDILLNVNMDMLGLNTKGELYASGAYHYPQLKPLLEKVKPRAKARLLLGHDRPEQLHDDWTNQSDHYHFHKHNIPFAYFGVESHAHYHKPTDEYEALTPDFYADAAALVIDFIRIADKHFSK